MFLRVNIRPDAADRRNSLASHVIFPASCSFVVIGRAQASKTFSFFDASKLDKLDKFITRKHIPIDLEK